MREWKPVPQRLGLRAVGSVLAILAIAGLTMCALLVSNAPTVGSSDRVELADAAEYFNALEEGPASNYVKAPSLQKLAGHDSNPNDNSLRLHLLSRFMANKLKESPPRKEQLDGIWQRLAYARKVLGNDANEILGPKTRDRFGNLIRKRGGEDERRSERRMRRPEERKMAQGQELVQEDPSDSDSSSSSSARSPSHMRELNRLRKLLKSKYHLGNKREALAIAEKNAEDHRRRDYNNNDDDEAEGESHYRGSPRTREYREERRLRETLSRHPGAARALEAVLRGYNDHDDRSGRRENVRRSRRHSSLADSSSISSSNTNSNNNNNNNNNRQQPQQQQAIQSQPIHQFVDDESSQKLVIEGGPIPASGSVAVVGWLHRDASGDWAGKLFPKSSPQGLAAMQSPLAGGKGWFDGTVEATQVKQQQQPKPVAVQPRPVEQPVVVAAAQQPEQVISEVPEQAPVYSSELSQPMYDVVPEEYSSAELEPQISPTVNEFEIEPGFQVQ